MAEPTNAVTEKDTRSEEVAQVEPQGTRMSGLLRGYRNPYTQVCLLGFTCFLGPGMFNSLGGIGGGGGVDVTISANQNVILYACFAAMAFVAGSINNKIGALPTLFLGTLGYSIYIGSWLQSTSHPYTAASNGYTLASGAILGLCAGLLWTAQGSLMLSYATEQQKGRFIGIFWVIFNLGAVIGSAVAFGQNFNNSAATSVGSGTYIGFLVLTLLGACIPFLMTPPSKMIRTDGTQVQPLRHPTWIAEFTGLGVALYTDPMIMLLFPLFLVSNWFYTWQENDYNAALFTIRTRALNGMLYWATQMFGSIIFGLVLDTPRLARRTRAYIGWVCLLVVVMVTQGWSYHYQKGYTRESVAGQTEEEKIDFTSPGFAAYIWLYIFLGLLDSMWQTAAYWFMGAMSNDPAKLAYFAGFYKSIQSAGAAGIWRADGLSDPFMNIFASTWALLAAGLIFAAPVLFYRIKNHTELADEAILRMDDKGHVHEVSEMTEKPVVTDETA